MTQKRKVRKTVGTIKLGSKVSYNGEEYIVVGKSQKGSEGRKLRISKDAHDALLVKKGILVTARQVKPIKNYIVDCHWDVARSFEIPATSRKEALEKMWKRIEAGEVCVWTDQFEATEDVECECNGEENDEGEVEFD